MRVAVVPAQERYIPVAVRREVLARDGLICRLCDRPVSLGVGRRRVDALHFDHITPWAAGGPNTVENLRVTCRDCNLRRGRAFAVVRQPEGPDQPDRALRRDRRTRRRARLQQILSNPTPEDRARFEQLLASVPRTARHRRERGW